jgi:hypothetical protein
VVHLEAARCFSASSPIGAPSICSLTLNPRPVTPMPSRRCGIWCGPGC